MNRCVIVALIAVVALMSVTQTEAVVANIQKYYEFLRQTDDSIFAANVLTQDVSRMIDEATVSMGTVDPTLNFPNWLDASVRMNTVSELFVGICALRLVADTQLPSVDAAIPTKYLPRGVPFFNPGHTSTALTIRQLMTHTSSLMDSKFAQYQKFTPDSVMDLRSFVEAYFLVSAGGTFSTASDVWSTQKPGLDTSFRYARANTALLAYIIEQVIIEKPSLVASTSKTYMAFAQEQIMSKLGMTSTWVLGLNGANPKITYPAGTDPYSGKAVRDLQSAGTAQVNTAIHPAYPADYMYMTSAADLSRLVRALWLDENGPLRSIGSAMNQGLFPVGSTDTTTTTALFGQSKQGQALFNFDGPAMCAIAIASTVVEKCPLKANSNVWGHMGVGQHSLTGVFCTDVASTTNPTCVQVTMSFFDSGSNYKSYDKILGLAAVAFQESIGDKSTVQQSTSTGDNDNKYYGAWVFLGVIGIVTFVLVSSYFTEYLIQPAPISAGVAMPTAIPGMNGMDNMYGPR